MSQQDADTSTIPAYAKLVGERFVYYIRTLSLTLGRRVPGSEPVDVDLGPSRSISRVHARIDYDFRSRQFMISPLGKNGIVVNNSLYLPNHFPIPLKTKAAIQIGDVYFCFLLPVGDVSQSISPSENPPQLSICPPPEASAPVCMPASEVHCASSGSQSEGAEAESSSNVADPYEQQYDVNHKPPFSYATLISQAICSTPEKKITLNGIYKYIITKFPYYGNQEPSGWQNSIRHNLSLNKAFMRIPRALDEPGKGAFWAIDPSQSHLFEDGIYKGRTRTAAAFPCRASRPRSRIKSINSMTRAQNLNTDSHQSSMSDTSVPAMVPPPNL